MYELTNEQRACFGLSPVEPHWVPMVLKPSPYHRHTTVAYREGLTLRKIIYSGPDRYVETALNDQLSEDLRYLLPRTGRGKPVLLTAASAEKRGGMGMCLRWLLSPSNLSLLHEESQHVWYDYHYEGFSVETIEDFAAWVDRWCAETTQKDLDDLAALAQSKRLHVKYREGDVFRFRISRRLWGYGRILLDYRKMKKRGEPIISPFISGCLDCAVYHIVTERDDVTVEELEKLPCLPATHISDNRIYYGDYEIIGHIPLREKEDWPILYDHIYRENKALLQCGRLLRSLPDAPNVAKNFDYLYISPWLIEPLLPILRECMEAGNNGPYWAAQGLYHRRDLRNPRHRPELERVCQQMGLDPEDLLAPGDQVR